MKTEFDESIPVNDFDWLAELVASNPIKRVGYCLDYELIMITPMAFTWALKLKVDRLGYDERICFNSLADANKGFDAIMQNKGELTDRLKGTNWIKIKGYGKADIRNFEYEETN